MSHYLKKISGPLALVFLFVVPLAAFAQQRAQDILDSFGDLVGAAIPIAAALALLAFFWGLAKFIFAAGDEDGRTRGKQVMLWGIIALFVVVSIWGIVAFIGISLLGEDPTTGGGSRAPIPCLEGLPGCPSGGSGEVDICVGPDCP